MSVSPLPLQVLGPRTTGSRAEVVQTHRATLLRLPLWLLLPGIIVTGIVLGLFATTITASLLSDSVAQAGDPVNGTVPPHSGTVLARVASIWLYEITQLCRHRNIHQGGRTMSSNPPSKSFPGTLIEAAGDKEGVAAAVRDRLAEDVSSLRAD